MYMKTDTIDLENELSRMYSKTCLTQPFKIDKTKV